jgi:predicted DNA-binding mobile mystery protein A
MRGTQLARRLKLAPSTVHELESSEKNGTITLNSLQKCAEAMGCRLVYAIVPETSLDEIVRGQAMKRSAELARNVQNTMALENQYVTSEATESMIRDKADELRLRGGRDLWS